MTANLLTLNSYQIEFLLIGLKNQIAKIHNSSLNTSHSAWNLGFIFDEHLTFSDQITSLQRLLLSHSPTSLYNTTATSIAHSKLDYCNSLYYMLPKSKAYEPGGLGGCSPPRVGQNDFLSGNLADCPGFFGQNWFSSPKKIGPYAYALSLNYPANSELSCSCCC